MKNTKRLLTTLCLSGILALTGCQSMGDSSSGSGQVDPRIQNSKDFSFFSKSGWEACAVGAGVGILGCAVSKSSNKTVCMAAAAIVGCGVGMGANAYLDYQRSKYATKEARLNATITDVQQENMKLQNATATAKSVIADNRNTLTQLDKQIANKSIDKASANKKLADIDANIATLRTTLANTKDHEKQWSDVAAKEKIQGNKTTKLDSEIAKMHNQVVDLQKEVDSLYTQRSAIKIG